MPRPRYNPIPAPPSPSNPNIPLIHEFPCVLPRPDFTFQDYVDQSPPVTGHIMALFAGKGRRVHLPCEIIHFDKKKKKALVKAADGVEITVVNITTDITNRCIRFWGLPTAGTVLHALDAEVLPDDHDFERAQWFIEYLLRPANWGETPPSREARIASQKPPTKRAKAGQAKAGQKS